MKKLEIGTIVESKLQNISGMIVGYFENRYKIMTAEGETWYIDQQKIKGGK